MSATITISAVEIAHIELSYAHTRIRRSRQVLTLADSLLRCGQLLPIVVVPAESSGFVLIDGYQRVEAARRAGIDTLQAQIWVQSEPEALCRLLATDGARQFDVFEQAAVLRELKSTHGLSQNRIAAQMGRHPSWITRRLALIAELPQAAVEAVRAGLLSSWSASRVVAPLARANGAHARALVDALAKEPLTSRQLHGFWHHYRKANSALREKMAADPVLFFKSLAARQADDQHRLTDGPEEKWLRELCIAVNILARLQKTARKVFYPRQSTLCRRRMTTAFTDAKDCFERLQRTIGRLCNEKANRPTDRDRHAPGRTEHPTDQQADENVAKDHPAHPGRPCARGPQPAQPL